ncbi:MAG: hypothetical protein A4E38_01434 [Methanoregulaceae archaeon PtaB.Bin108]|nr:MAG: hypothetical protein A4E38_01434 [Methanoregulaceae archaeon PtaB.Bin108]
MIRRRFHFRETIATILAEEEVHVEAARKGMIEARRDIEHHIALDPFFKATLEPYQVQSKSTVINRMAKAGMSASVGPMAAVAGTIAWSGVEHMLRAGAETAVIDNGGDIVLCSDRVLHVGIHAGASSHSDTLAFEVPPQEGILGICTSSATVGPSISFGIADAVTVFSQNPAVADAWATSICNTITKEDTRIMERVPWQDVQGILVIAGEWMESFGDLPPVVKAKVNRDLVTGGPW